MKTIALVNNKGGVAKTTSAVNLAAGIAAEGYRVLLADLDAQGSASLSLGLSRADLSPGIAEVILENRPIRDAVRPSSVQGMDILPGSMKLASADLALADVKGREAVLKAVLSPIRADYDFTILDCPPSLGLLTVNALTASDSFIIPLTPEYLALEGLINLMEAVDRIHAGIGDKCRLLGILLTKVDRRRRVTEEIIQVLRDHYKSQVFRTEIGVDVRLVEAPSFGQTIFQYDRRSSAAEAYLTLARQITKKGKRS